MARLKVRFPGSIPLFAGAGALLVALAADAAKVESVEYDKTDSGGEIVIRSDAEIRFDSESNEQDRQIVLNLKDTELAGKAGRKIDASAKGGPVLQISP